MPAAAPRLVGRDAELATLAALTRALASGVGGCCVVAGPAGIGKTALVTVALQEAEQAGVRVLRARGFELEGSLSFGAVRDLLGPAVLRLPPRDQDALLTGPAGFARPVLGLGPSDDGDPLYGLFWLAVALAERQPLLLAVDDLHWLDQESARFLAYLARRVEGLPILLLATAQTHVDGPAAEPMADVVAAADLVELAPLSADDLVELVPGRSADEVHQLTGGNPMLAVELGRALDADPDAELASVSMRGVGAGILRRVNRLSTDAVELARAVAISPQRLTLGDASALAMIEDPQRAAAAADALVRAAVLEWDGERLGFLHPLMRRAVYDDLDPVGRRAAHDRAAAVLLDRGADAETVAAQLLAAEPRGSDANVDVLVEAADEAQARMAPRAVAAYLTRAVAEPPTDKAALAALRHRLGRVLLDLGRTDAAVEVLAAAHDVAQDDVRITVDLALAMMADARPAAAAALLAPYRTEVPTTEEQLEVTATWLLAHLDFDPEIPGSVGIDASLDGSTPVRRRALVAHGVQLLATNAPPEAMRPVALASLGDLGPPSPFDRFRSVLLASAGLLDERRVIATEELERARRTGETARYAAAQQLLALIDNQCGRLREAEATLRLALEAPDLAGQWRLDLEGWLITTLSMQGRFAEADALLEELTRRPDQDQSLAFFHLDIRRAELASDRGDYAAVVEPAERALAVLPPEGFSALGCDLAVALGALGRRDRAEPLARTVLAAAEKIGNPQSVGIASAALGRVVGGDEGLALLERAVATLADSPYRWNQANAEVALGAALRVSGKRARAREVLESALEYAVANDAAPIEKAAREELRLCGARPRRAARTGAAALTPAEERIARLAAGGMSNKQIAQHLFVTVKNVEMHLVHAYRKLEVSSRRELSGVLSDPP